MSRYLTFEQLSRGGREYVEQFDQNELKARRHSDQRLKLFLLYKPSEDEKLVMWVKGFIHTLVGDACIEWLDVNVGEIYSVDDAKRLKETITNAKKVIVLATPECLQYSWTPWEIGIADQMKGAGNIAVLPVIHQARNWEKRELLTLYSRIEKPEKEWMVLSPGYDFQGVPFSEWLEK